MTFISHMQLKLLAKFNAAFILKPTEGNLIAPFLDRIVQKQRRETRKEELEITSACQRNMRSREPYVARALEDVFRRPRYSRLAASPLAARMSRMPSRSFSLRIFEQKRDCSQSRLAIVVLDIKYFTSCQYTIFSYLRLSRPR